MTTCGRVLVSPSSIPCALNSPSSNPPHWTFFQLVRWPPLASSSSRNQSFQLRILLSRGKAILSYLLAGVTATGDDGDTAHFHDYRDILVSTESRKAEAEESSGIEYAHFIVKVPVSGRGWRVVCRSTELSRSKSSFFRLGERVQGKGDLCAMP